MKGFPRSTVRRYKLSKVTEAAELYRLRSGRFAALDYPEAFYTHRTDFALEFPTVNPLAKMRPYQFAYGISCTPDADNMPDQIWNSLVKADLVTKTRQEWQQEGCYPSTFYFPPS